MKRKDLFVYLMLLAMTLVFFFRFLDGREVFAFKDLSRYFYPLRHLMAEQVAAGALPLWNPYIYFGMPLMAGLQVGFFYPLTTIHYFLPFDLAFNYYIVIHYFLAALFMYLFLRHLEVSRPGSAVAAISFAFSGYLLSVSNMNTSLTSVVWLPLALLFWDRFLRSGGLDLVWSVLALSMMFLGGEPTIIYVTGLVMLCWGAVFAEGWTNKLRSAAALAAVFLGVACLAGVQLLPFLELVIHSNRLTMAEYRLVSMRSLPLREAVGFFLPYFYGNQILAGNYSPMILGKILQDWLISPYLGIVPFVLLGFSFSGRSKRTAVFFAATALISLLAAFGNYTPFYHVLYRFLPGISIIRYPIKYVFLATFSICILAGIGYDNALRDEKSSRKGLTVFTLLFAFLGIAYALSGYFRKEIFFFLKSQHAGLPPYFTAVLWHNVLFNIKSLLQTAAIALSCAAIFFLRQKRWLKDAAFGTALAGILFFDLLSNNASLNVPSQAGVYHEVTPNLKAIMPQAGISRIFYSNELEKHNRSVYGPDFDAALIESLDKLTSDRLIPYHLYDSFGYESIELGGYVEFYREFMWKHPFKKMNIVDLTDSRYLADLKPIIAPGIRPIGKREYFYGRLYLYENPGHLARPFIVGRYLVAKDRKAAFAAMNDGRFDPGEVVVLPEDPKVTVRKGRSRTAMTVYRPNEVSVEAELSAPGFLVLSDSYYPGWKALVDGRETRIYRADHIFRAVYLGAGRHSVRFIYDPLSLKLGAGLSILGVLGLAGFALYLAKKAK